MDGNEGRRLLQVRRIEGSASMFFDPGMNGEDGTTDFTSDLGSGNVRSKHKIDGRFTDVVGVMGAWHDGSGVRGSENGSTLEP